MVPTSDPECAFCAIAGREDSDAREVYRDRFCVAFFPTEPATLGHTLLIPRAHVPDIWDLEPELAERLARTAVSLAHAVRQAVRPDGLNLIQSNGAAATQTVLHLHIHLVPRWEGDELGRIWPRETHYTEDSKDAAWATLRAQARAIMKHT